MSRDARYIKLINSSRWRKTRGLQLSASPLCERCTAKGRITEATEVHHRVPLESIKDARQQERMAYDPSNLMSVCPACHKELHTALRSGTKEERRRRAEEDARLFLSSWLGDGGTGG